MIVKPAKSTEKQYAKALRQIAKHASHIVDMHADGAEIKAPTRMMEALRKYAEEIEPWASRQAKRMLSATNLRSDRAFMAHSKKIGQLLKDEIKTGSVGRTTLALQAEQVSLIQSIPLKAGERAQELAMSAYTGGRRADEVAAEIARTNAVTESRAMLIARTEVSKASTALTQARSTSVGSSGYIWRTADDSDVRESHAEMEGQFVPWDSPPTLDGMTGHAGEFPNCRCYAEVVLPE